MILNSCYVASKLAAYRHRLRDSLEVMVWIITEPLSVTTISPSSVEMLLKTVENCLSWKSKLTAQRPTEDLPSYLSTAGF
eukprot:1318021-Amorphochlora_amoeboformis.AAC.1